MAKRSYELLVTCEHAGNRVPPRYVGLFRGHRDLLESHRGFDLGALPVARRLARELRSELIHSTITRLLVDLNRSLGHRAVLSTITRQLPADERAAIVARYYAPYRQKVLRLIRLAARRGQRVIHIGVHSFTPVLNGRVRQLDIGLLYDPSRRREASLCHHWRDALHRIDPRLRVRMNYPYRGTSDGLTTALRRQFPARRYLGIELEVNQSIATGRRAAGVARALTDSLAEALGRVERRG